MEALNEFLEAFIRASGYMLVICGTVIMSISFCVGMGGEADRKSMLWLIALGTIVAAAGVIFCVM